MAVHGAARAHLEHFHALDAGNGGLWSRRKYLRTDKHYNCYQFRSVLGAARFQDAELTLAMVRWLYAHFRGCVVPFEAVHQVAGTATSSCSSSSSSTRCRPARAERRDPHGHVVHWGRHDVAWVKFARQRQTDVVH
ncbi:uncharacterized protein IUM83_17933 [Phytophthora cinnamomi]|uniref:uncharacterized protein n=1 Tax=Phytophthora cinnamomi TaxID=4785 RepID=UPI00355979CA|nr:hypothetical protein IUM83_17933 [Phytophthora cinnamomi]